MNPLNLREELHRFQLDQPIERAWMPPSSWYTSRDLSDLEEAAVFACTWQPIARLDQLKDPGAYVSGVLAGQPWVVLRNESNELRGFHNTCRHKGREVVTGSGNAAQLVCGYHAWTYDHEGRLSSAPRMGGVEEFDRSAVCLPQIQVQEWGLWCFMNMSAELTRLDEHLGELHLRLGSPDWDEYEFFGERRWAIDCNWKVVCDNYLDGGYHIPHMHPSLDAQIDMDGYETQLFDTHSIQTAPPKPSHDDRIDYEASDRIGDSARYAWIYPNLMINRYGPCIDTNLVIPLGPDRCEVLYQFYFDKSVEIEPDFLKESMDQSDLTQREDVSICESVQRGLRSMSYESGRYAPKVELAEHHFHTLLAKALTEALDADR